MVSVVPSTRQLKRVVMIVSLVVVCRLEVRAFRSPRSARSPVAPGRAGGV